MTRGSQLSVSNGDVSPVGGGGGHQSRPYACWPVVAMVAHRGDGRPGHGHRGDMMTSRKASAGGRIAHDRAADTAAWVDVMPPHRPWGVPGGGRVANRYRLVSRIGWGSMGMVWLAQDELLCRSVAVKQIVHRGVGTSGMPSAEMRRARSEARYVARVDDPGVLRIHDLVEDGGSMWLVTELLCGRSLRDALETDGPLSPDVVKGIALHLLDALVATHQAGIVHRDVKPGNVYLCRDGRVELIDFGIAESSDDDSTASAVEFEGSPAFVAPERIGAGEVGPASDLFSLGVTLFAAVEGVPPFRRGSIFETLAAVREDEPGPFLRAGVLQPIIEGLLAKRPEQRLSAEDAREALEAIGEEPLREGRGLMRLPSLRPDICHRGS